MVDPAGPKWPTEEPDAATLFAYAAARGSFMGGVTWGYIEAGVFDRPPEDDRLMRAYLNATTDMIAWHNVALLLRELREADTARADAAARHIWLASEAGDSFGEWLWEWCRDSGSDGDQLYEDGKALAMRLADEWKTNP